MRKCSKCNELKSLNEFMTKNKVPFYVCKVCGKIKQKKWQLNNKDKLKNYQKKYHQNHKGKANDYVKKRGPAYAMLYSARNRAKKLGLEFNLTIKDIAVPEYCPVLGIKLEFRKGGHSAKIKDFTYSIDRINNNKGYTKDNIIITSWRANRIKTDASLEELKKLYEFYKNVEENNNGRSIN